MQEEKLKKLKARHALAVQDMLASIDKANELKAQIWRIECERDKKP